eukprot:3935268-Pleurochrysis_carterae.AAC.1
MKQKHFNWRTDTRAVTQPCDTCLYALSLLILPLVSVDRIRPGRRRWRDDRGGWIGLDGGHRACGAQRALHPLPCASDERQSGFIVIPELKKRQCLRLRVLSGALFAMTTHIGRTRT